MKAYFFLLLLLIQSGKSIRIKSNSHTVTTLNTFLLYFEEYSNIQISDSEIAEIKRENSNYNEDNPTSTTITIRSFFNKSKRELIFTGKQQIENALKNSETSLKRNRYNTGWDELNVKTFSETNPLLQCFAAGFSEGVLSYKEIEYYFDNIHVFFHYDLESIKQLKDLYVKIDSNLKSKLTREYFSSLQIDELKKWVYITCLNAQINGLFQGYNKAADRKLDLADFYFINSEGNFGDLKTFLQVNKMDIADPDSFFVKENLEKFYKTSNIVDIWDKIIHRSHCSAIIKLVENEEGVLDIFSGHNTWTDYSEMIRTLKYYEFAFEGENQVIGMAPKEINFSSYPGVLFSGDDFYLLDNQVVLLQTTLSPINTFIYKNIINIDNYIMEFMRIMTSIYMTTSGKSFYEQYSSYKDHMYLTQWVVIDYKELDKINQRKTKTGAENLVYLIEEIPGNIRGKDMTSFFLEKKYFGSFNLPYFAQDLDKMGISRFEGVSDLSDKRFNPRYYILSNLHDQVHELDQFRDLMLYNGYRKVSFFDDPSKNDAGNGISARDDITRGGYHGGVDFKIVDRALAKSMQIYVYGGPAFNENIPPFRVEDVRDYHKQYMKGLPKVWKFEPFVFGKENFLTSSKKRQEKSLFDIYE